MKVDLSNTHIEKSTTGMVESYDPYVLEPCVDVDFDSSSPYDPSEANIPVLEFMSLEDVEDFITMLQDVARITWK